MFFKSKAQAPEFIEVRSYNNAAFHIRPNEEGFPAALCGYTNWVSTNNDLPVDGQKVLDSKDNQHAGWYWCPDCASILTGVDRQVFIDAIQR